MALFIYWVLLLGIMAVISMHLVMHGGMRLLFPPKQKRFSSMMETFMALAGGISMMACSIYYIEQVKIGREISFTNGSLVIEESEWDIAVNWHYLSAKQYMWGHVLAIPFCVLGVMLLWKQQYHQKAIGMLLIIASIAMAACLSYEYFFY